MKKIVVFLVLFQILFLSSCNIVDFINAPLYKKMTEYYSEDDNYVELTGEIIEKKGEIIYIRLSTEFSEFNIYKQDVIEFQIYGEVNAEEALVQNEYISFISAPNYFYNGHILPIVCIQKEEITHLDFNDGKESLLEWVEDAFGPSNSR